MGSCADGNVTDVKTSRMRRLLALAALLLTTAVFAQAPDTWTSKELLTPADLAARLQKGRQTADGLRGTGLVVPVQAHSGRVGYRNGIEAGRDRRIDHCCQG